MFGTAYPEENRDPHDECRFEIEKLTESLRIATERIADLEGGLTTLHLQFGEPYYSWQRVLMHVQALIRRRNACAEACLNAIGFLDGMGTLPKAELTQRLVDAVKPILSAAEELPEFVQVSGAIDRQWDYLNAIEQLIGSAEGDDPEVILNQIWIRLAGLRGVKLDGQLKPVHGA